MKRAFCFAALLLGAALGIAGIRQSGWAQDDDHGGVIIFTKPVKAVIFDHQVHIDMGFECDSCHEDLFAYAAGTAEENSDFTMESLYAGKYCGACHDGETAFASDTKCAVCHIGVKGYNKLIRIDSGQEGHGHR